MSLAIYKARIESDLLDTFCEGKANYNFLGFRPDYNKLRDLSEQEFSDCLKALDTNLVKHQGSGLYCAAKRNKGGHPFFWDLNADNIPRTFTISKEPIIIFAAITRLHFEFGWPVALLGTETKGGAFDFTTHLTLEAPSEYIAGEAKSSAREFNKLIGLMTSPDIAQSNRQSNAVTNAAKKAAALRLRQIPIFWAVGPGGLSRVFRPCYESGNVTFSEATTDQLQYALVQTDPPSGAGGIRRTGVRGPSAGDGAR